MDTRLHAVDRVLMITTTVIAYALLGIFATTLMACAGISWLIRRFINWKQQPASKHDQELGNIARIVHPGP